MITIVGPTSSGKTSLAIKLCKKYNGEIISADSRQLYKKMDIGTGKIPVSDIDFEIERKDKYWIVNDVVIHGYDLVYPNERFSVADFLLFFNEKKKEVLKSGKQVFLVGGTGLYMDVILGSIPISNVEKNLHLRNELSELTVKELQNLLPQKILKSMNNSDINNPRRLTRRIEILKNGKMNLDNKIEPIINNKIIGLTASRDYLYKKVDRWINLIWDDLVTEVKLLFILGYKDMGPLNGLIYKTVKQFLVNKVNKEDAIQRIQFDLHGYIRRQETWFKRNEKIHWFDVEDMGLFNSVENLMA